MNTPRGLWYHLMFPLILTFMLLWAGTMVLLTHYTCEALEETVQTGKSNFSYLAAEQMPFYEKNRHSDRPDAQAWAEAIMTYNLSTSPLWEVDGALAWVYWEDDKPIMESQLTTGYAHQAGVDQGDRWHLDFDTGLDDEGQLALARWIADHHNPGFGSYSILPSPTDSVTSEPDSSYRDGTFARITGEPRPGDVLVVDKLQLIHPDGSVELVVETNHRSSAPVTMDFRFLRLDTVLLPTMNPKAALPGLEDRLAQWREAQALALEQNVQHSGNGLRTASVYNVQPVAFRQMRSTYISTFLLTLGAALLLGLTLSYKVNEPVEALCRQTDTGHCDEQNPVSELNTLAKAINRSHKKMEEQLSRERDFTRAAAHELKTPLAVLRTHAEALQEDIAPAKRDQYLDVVLDESDRMAQLISSLLELSQMEKGTPLDMELFDLSPLVRSVFEPLALPLERKNMALTLALSPVEIQGDKARIQSAVENLASNALRYGSEGGNVEVTLHADNGAALLTVYNDGTPIPEEHLPHLFEPFYRVDKARSRNLGGTGLGLAIVKAAAEAHGGTCTAENTPTGVKFTLSLPVSH